MQANPAHSRFHKYPGSVKDFIPDTVEKASGQAVVVDAQGIFTGQKWLYKAEVAGTLTRDVRR